MRATSKIVMLRCYGWWWEDSVANMIRVLDSFIKHSYPSILTNMPHPASIY